MARLLQDGKLVQEATLAYAGTRSTYSTSLEKVSAGTYQLEVLALDAENVNFGRIESSITIAH